MSTARWLGVVAAVLVVAVGAGLALAAALPVPFRPAFPAWVRVVGVLAAAGGAGLAGWTFAHHPAPLMARVTARTIEIGARSLDPATSAVPRLITTGPYAHVRNPTYLAVLLIVLGLALAVPLAGLVVSGAILLLWWDLVVIPPEESELAARFGAEYEAYRRRVRRLVPRLRPGP